MDDADVCGGEGNPVLVCTQMKNNPFFMTADKRKKIFLLFVICMTLVLLVTGCGADRMAYATSDITTPAAEDKAAPEEQEPVAAEEQAESSSLEKPGETYILEEKTETEETAAVEETVITESSEEKAVTGSAKEEQGNISDSALADGSALLISAAVPETTVLIDTVPNYDGNSSTVINNDMPDLDALVSEMRDGEIWLSELDSLGRAGTAMTAISTI